MVKARSDTYGATGHAHSVIFVTLHNNSYYFFIPVRGRLRVRVGVGVNKTQSNRYTINFIVHFRSELYPF